jgi:hypothetical protein
MVATDMLEFLSGQLADVETTWSMGTFGAIAEFARDGGETAVPHRDSHSVAIATARGGIRLAAADGLRLFASETLTAQNWNQRVALCLPEAACAMSRRTVLTEIGPDHSALRAEDRTAVLFDLGLGVLQLDACVRVADTAFAEALRRWIGQSLFSPQSGAMGEIMAAQPHRVFLSRVGRVEVFQPIPPPDATSPDGPHTHVLPKLLRHKRTHAATERLPPGWIPCAHFYPAHPLRDRAWEPRPFRLERHAAFQTLLARYGDPDLVRIKRKIGESIAAGCSPTDFGHSADRFARASIRIALRQLQAAEADLPGLAAWRAVYERPDPDLPDDAKGDYPCTASSVELKR